MTDHLPERRDLLRVAALAAASLGTAGTAQAQAAVPFSTGTAAARTQAPPNATDCHFHIYDKTFPAVANAVLLPPDATVENYRALQKRTGTTRGVLVQPSTYGTDNRLHLDSMKALGPDKFRMVAVVNDSVTDQELRRLHEAGVRGIRFNLAQTGATTIEMLQPLSARVNELGWHCQINMPGAKIVEAQDHFLRIPGRLVFDHLAHVPEPEGTGSPTFALIRRLLDKGNTWVKLSGAYADTKVGPPSYSDSTAVAKALHAANPQRMVWGSDWPHPTEPVDKKPDDAVLFDLLGAWVPDEAARRRVLVDNPAELYDFPKG